MREGADDIAFEVISRLRDPSKVAEMAETEVHQIGVPGLWDPVSFSSGFAGLAVTHLATIGVEPGAEATARRHMAAALAHMPSRGTTSVTAGYGSLAAAAVVVSRATDEYDQMAKRGSMWLADQCERTVAEQLARWRTGETWADERMWDAVCGVSGAGRVLLESRERGLGDYEVTLLGIASMLTRLTEPVTHLGATRPGWWIRPGVNRRCLAGGCDPGLAHGISGPLTFLSQSYRAGLRVSDHRDAITAIAGWLIDARKPDHRWPFTVPISSDGDTGDSTARSAWCYGAAGVARSLYLAGTAIGDGWIAAAGLDALRAMTVQSTRSWRLWGPTFCHGLAGLLQILNRIAADADDPVLRGMVDRVVSEIVDEYREGPHFGFSHVHDQGGESSLRAALPGVLTGAAGVALALVSTTLPPSVQWDLPLMLA